MLDDALLTDQTERAIRDERSTPSGPCGAPSRRSRSSSTRPATTTSASAAATSISSASASCGSSWARRPSSQAAGPAGPWCSSRTSSPPPTPRPARSDMLAFVTDVGTSTSHTAIMARALSIPAVVGAPDVTKRGRHGDVRRGRRPARRGHRSPERGRRDAADRGRRYMAFVRSLRTTATRPRAPAAACPSSLRANIELPAEARRASTTAPTASGSTARSSSTSTGASRRPRTSSSRSTGAS
jgi:hypothetical protein